jgi:YVTN family beta-propeller protein
VQLYSNIKRKYFALALLAIVTISIMSVELYYTAVAQPFSQLQPSVSNSSNSVNATSGNQLSQSSIATDGINVENAPNAVAVDPKTNMIYVVNARSNTISVIDPVGKVVTNIPVGNFPVSIAINPIDRLAYVANLHSDTVSVIDMTRYDVVNSVRTMGEGPNGIAVDTNLLTPVVLVTTAHRFIKIDSLDYIKYNFTSEEGSSFTNVAVNPNTNMAYVVDTNKKIVSVINDINNKIVANISTGGVFPYGIAVNPNTNMIYLCDQAMDEIYVVNGSTNHITNNIPVEGPYGIAVNPNTNMIYVTNTDLNTVSIIDGKLNMVIKNIRVGEYPRGIAVNPNTNMIYATNQHSNTVSVIDGVKYGILVGVTFDVSPNNAGNIYCNRQKITNNSTLLYISNRTLTCEAKANGIFPPTWFTSWSGDLASLINPNQDQIMFKPSQFGTLIAKFDVWNVLSDTYISTYLAIAIPAIGGLLYKSRGMIYKFKRQKNLNKYSKIIDNIYEISYHDRKECSQLLGEVRNRMTDLFINGDISKSDYQILNKKILEYTNSAEKS